MRNVLYLSLLFISTSVKAQQDSSEKTLEPVIVTAQRMSQKPELVPYTVITVRKQSLNELQPRTTPEALQGVNGVFVQKTNHGGGSPFVRGLAGNQILVLVDGIRLNNSTFRYGPNQYLNTVDAFMADRIEVAKGTGAVQYGSDALGGVIHVLAKDPEFAAGRALHGRILGKYTTRNMEQTARGDLDYSSKTAALTGGVTYRNFGNLYGGDTTGVQNPSGYKEWAFNSKAKFLLSNSVQLTVSSQSLQQQHVPVYHKVRLENFRINEMNRQQRNLHYARLQIRNQNPLWGTVEITTSIQQSTEARRMQKNGSSLLVQEQDKIRTVGVSAAVVSRYKPWWTSNSGIEMYSDNVRSLREETDTENNIKTGKRGLYPDNGKHDNYAVYSLHQFLLKKLVVNAGLRLNVFSIRLQDTSLGEVRFNPQALVGNIALMYPLSTRHHIYANYGTGFRAPNIDDMGSLGVVDFRYEVPSYDLRPEKTKNLELGYRLQLKKLRGNLALYYMMLNDLITRSKIEGPLINGYSVYQKMNSEQAFVRGVETEMEWEVANGFTVNGGVAYTYGQNLTKEEPLRRIPPFNGRLMPAFRKNNWFAAIEFLFAGKQERLAKGDREDNRIPAGGTPGWQVCNAYLNYKNEGVQFGVGLQNIFNVDYRMHGSGINGVGRSAWFSIGLFF